MDFVCRSRGDICARSRHRSEMARCAQHTESNPNRAEIGERERIHSRMSRRCCAGGLRWIPIGQPCSYSNDYRRRNPGNSVMDTSEHYSVV